jgi:hypothetical protein
VWKKAPQNGLMASLRGIAMVFENRLFVKNMQALPGCFL